MKRLMLLLLAILLIGTQVHAQGDNLETMYTNKAMKAYVVKDFAGAIQYLEQVLQVNPKNTQANKLLALCYYNRAEQYFAKGESQMAQEQLDLLFQYDPESAKGKTLAAKIQRALAPKPSVRTEPAYAPPPVQVAPAAPQQIVIQAPENGGSEAMIQGFLAQVDRSNKILEETNVSQRYSDSLRAVEQQRVVDLLKSTAQEGATSSQKTILMVSGIVAGLILVVVLIIVVVVRTSIKSSQKFQQQNQEVIQQLLLTAASSAMQQQNLNPQLMLTGPSGSVPSQATGGSQTTTNAESKLESPDDKERADAVEKVASEIAAAPTSPGNIAKLEKLKKMLDDSSNRVRANTALVLFKYYPDLSLKTLKEMVESGSKRMAASAIWSLGEINTRESFEILLSPSIDKSDEIITHNLLTSARKIQQKSVFAMSDEEKLHLVELIESLEK